MHLQRNLVLASFLATGLLLGCSGGDPASAPPPVLTSAEISAHATAALANPGEEIQSITSSAPGIATWTFYGSSNGVVAVGQDATGATKAELAVLSVGTGDEAYMQGGAYAIAADLKTTPQALGAALNADIDSQVTDSSSDDSAQSKSAAAGEVDGLISSTGSTIVNAGKALVKACGTTLLRAAGGALIAGAGYAAGAALEAACPETVGLGCVAGAWAQSKATTTALGVACPNIPATIPAAIKNVLTPSPAM